MTTKCGDSVRVAHPLFQGETGGSTPTSPLQLNIEEIPLDQAKDLNRLWHSRLPQYRTGCRPKQHAWVCFGAIFENRIYAIAIWSHPNSRALDSSDTLELRRMAISPDAPKNTASRMLSIMVKEIRKIEPAMVRFISYQDTEVHAGTIYKAANWFKAAENDAMDYSMAGKRSRPPKPNNARKIRWEYLIK